MGYRGSLNPCIRFSLVPDSLTMFNGERGVDVFHVMKRILLQFIMKGRGLILIRSRADPFFSLQTGSERLH